MPEAKRLIEVAMPVKEVSSECKRDDRIQHGHISSLHKWWARRPLPVCRAVVFASLVPDPLDAACPAAFREAVEMLLGKGRNANDPYKPYEDIPYTSAFDKMDDNLRNRLLMFIGKYSDTFAKNERCGKQTPAGDQISNESLIKWESKNNDITINKARKLIWVAHNAKNGTPVNDLLTDFDNCYKAIKEAENRLYDLEDRHNATDVVRKREQQLQSAIEMFLNKMPKVFDPFAGGGAIPLEAARLGCRSYGNDINPVAHIIQKASVEFPQRFGKPIIFSKEEFSRIYGTKLWESSPIENKIIKHGEAIGIKLENRLSYDVAFYVNKVIELAKTEIGHLYPESKPGGEARVYYWVRVGKCSNPTCKAEVPLLKQFYVCNKDDKKVYLEPIIQGNKIDFAIANGTCEIPGWVSRGNMICPCCNNVTTSEALKKQFIIGDTSDRLVCVIKDGDRGKEYYVPTRIDLDAVKQVPIPSSKPSEKLPVKYTKAMAFCLWGFEEWGQMFSDRQLIAIETLIKCFHSLTFESLEEEYSKAVKSYLAIWIDRMAARLTKFGIIDLGGEKVVDLFGLQAVQMVFDYPELNVFRLEQLSWIEKFIESESSNPFVATVSNVSSGERHQFQKKSIDTVVTDPPYYDSVAYADLSDFFYVWLKRSIGQLYPLTFATPQTPKADECTALKHHHNNNEKMARGHFESKLKQIFEAIEHQTKNNVSIMFAHQSTEAWTTLCNSILGAEMNITGSWAMGTEKKGGLKENKAFLSSSVTVSCLPSVPQGVGAYKEVKKAIERTVAKEVTELYNLGFRGADLLTACFGQAVSEFGKYIKVEKADGSEIKVSELLEMARESAFNALLKGFDGDEFTKFYIGWLQLNGFSQTDFGDLNNLVKVGLKIETRALFDEHILIKEGNKQTLASFEERVLRSKKLGDQLESFLIDKVHRAMALYKSGNRKQLLQYIGKVAALPEDSFWRVATSLDELLPKGSEDQRQVNGLLINKDSLIRESRNSGAPAATQGALEI